MLSHAPLYQKTGAGARMVGLGWEKALEICFKALHLTANKEYIFGSLAFSVN